MMPSESFLDDYSALTTGGGLVAFSHWSTIKITGKDRLSFLHNMCTNDIRNLSPGQGCEAFCTDVKGKIIAHVYVFAKADYVELLTNGQAAELIIHLERYVIREDVQLSDQSNASCWHLLSGTDSETLLRNAGSAPSELPQSSWSHTTAKIGQVNCVLAPCELTWPKSYLLQTDSGQETDLIENLKSAGAKLSSTSAFESVRVESGWPLFQADFSSENLPQEIDRDPLAIHFNKGCYLGQETIARIDALGHVNQKIVLLQLTGNTIPTRGVEVTQDKKIVGKLTSCCWSPRTQSPLALAMVRRGANEIGSQVEVAQMSATVIKKFERGATS